jgi:predicted Zn finger-like uncharacterized protein
MKFLCPSCKAKYQIADDKVAGRSVRMKCRKCGHVIHISKTVTDGAAPDSQQVTGETLPPPPSEAPPPPKVETPRVAPAAAKAAGLTARVPAARPAPSRPSAPGPPPPARPAPTRPGIPARSAVPVRPAPPPRKSTLQGGVGLAPRASSAAAAPARAPLPGPEPVNYSDAELKPAAPTGALAAAFAQSDAEPPSALAGAFTHAVGAPPSSAFKDVSAPADEWYVGINGVPVGPIKLSELRSKSAAGAVTYDSLVWREGFEQWQALRTFPELVAIVEESLSSARASLTPLAPPAGMGDAFAPAPAPQQPFGEPFGAGAGPAPVTGPAVVTERPEALEDMLGIRPRRGSPAAWIAVAVALLFGLTIGFVVFSQRAPAEPIVKYVEVPAKGQASAGNQGSAPAESAETIEEATVAGGKSGPRTGGPAPPTKPGEEPPKKGLTGLNGLGGLQGGPASGPGSETSAGSAGQPLDGASVQKTVGRYTSSVRRSCWQPALDTRAKDAPTAARVTVTITVGPSGNVQNATTSGDPRGYRGLASCIGSRVRGWQFPASSGTTTVNVPFVFAAQ